MPTYELLPRFWRDFERLSKADREAFKQAVELFKEGLSTGQFHPSLRLHRIGSAPGVWSLSWGDDNDGRATFEYGSRRKAEEAHIIWRRVGKHAIYRRP